MLDISALHRGAHHRNVEFMHRALLGKMLRVGHQAAGEVGIDAHAGSSRCSSHWRPFAAQRSMTGNTAGASTARNESALSGVSGGHTLIKPGRDETRQDPARGQGSDVLSDVTIRMT